ncbi:lipoprotein N-acyltransferase Lnb domain-containing protein [Polaribacter aquimarinus]|uniref:Uncharacterized protein n=1 Tax=Polaribacter aquimarinus TaxID=2100726 RepID=A0A2U2J7J2_9FLAO|nr:DUF4105 domain-containing protein [Polaribacter aquimarinus]PWG04294.1 hypothetical protein DIS07_12850 [Polaribacter aquimarinus]
MKKKYFSFLLLFIFYYTAKAQINLSVYAEVSIVTAGPGDKLYEAFGHSAIRIKDPVLNFDLIYNYGVFDFNQPNFYSNFAKGNMIYSLARYDFKYFLRSYKRDKRWLKEQVLNLNQQEKQAYFSFLENNALPQNRNYQYDPYFDNCATILRDITKSILKNKVVFNNDDFEKELSFRDLTNKELNWNTWGSFALNLIAGIKLDEKATAEEYMYLPDYVYTQFRKAIIYNENQTKSLVKKETILLAFEEKQPSVSIFNPLLIFGFISLLGFFITYKDIKNRKRTKSLDFLLFFTTGFIGSILFFLWFFSSHSTAPNNFNILWAFPLNLIFSFQFLKKKLPNWIINYLKIITLLLIIIPILWIVKVQVYPLVIIPLLILIIFRYWFLQKYLLTSKI